MQKNLCVGDLELDEETQVVKRGGLTLEVSPIGRQLLAILMRASPRVVTREEIEIQIWGRHLPNSDSLRSHMYQLRRHVDKPFDIPLIHTLPSFGFRLAALDV